ncbi:MAG TPA: hypothetical protein VGM06_03900 [Polyangiaceae bacterium]
MINLQWIVGLARHPRLAMTGAACVPMIACWIVAGAGCTSLRGENETCSTVGTSVCSPEALVTDAGADGENSVFTDGYDWSCLGKAPPMSTPSVQYTAIVADFLPPQQAPPGLVVSLCPVLGWPQPTDVDASALPCFNPEAVTTIKDAGIPNSVTVTLPPVLQASSPYIYVAFEAPNRLPVAVWFSDPPMSDFLGTPPVLMFDPLTAESYAMGIGVTLSPATGLVIVSIHDCKGIPVAGAHATLDFANPPATPPVPFTLTSNGLPTTGSVLMTDSSGEFGFGNVPAGGPFVTATAFRADNTKIASATVYVRPGWATAAGIFPP